MLSSVQQNKLVNYKNIKLVPPLGEGIKKSLFFSMSGEENSPGWLCGEDEGKAMAPFWCPLLACHMPVFATKSPDRKVNPLPYHETKIIS